MVDDRVLHFELVGINNQNFLMRDRETGSWWQQVTGEAILGPLRGKRLTRVPSDEVALGIWRAEYPATRVLASDASYEEAYLSEDWAEGTKKLPTVTPVDEASGLEPRDLVIGIEHEGSAMAYPIDTLVAQKAVLDVVGGAPVFVVVAKDGRSIRAFDRRLDGRTLELFLEPDADPPRFVDGETGTVWSFSGEAIEGELGGRTLRRIQVLKDFWFDWQAYNPESGVFRAGL